MYLHWASSAVGCVVVLLCIHLNFKDYSKIHADSKEYHALHPFCRTKIKSNVESTKGNPSQQSRQLYPANLKIPLRWADAHDPTKSDPEVASCSAPRRTLTRSAFKEASLSCTDPFISFGYWFYAHEMLRDHPTHNSSTLANTTAFATASEWLVSQGESPIHPHTCY